MRTRLTIAIIAVLLVAVLFNSIVRRRPSPPVPSKRPKQLKAPEVVEVKPTLSQITNQEVSLFDTMGNPLVGYVEDRSGNVTLYSEPHGATALGNVIMPITKERAD